MFHHLIYTALNFKILDAQISHTYMSIKQYILPSLASVREYFVLERINHLIYITLGLQNFRFSNLSYLSITTLYSPFFGDVFIGEKPMKRECVFRAWENITCQWSSPGLIRYVRLGMSYLAYHKSAKNFRIMFILQIPYRHCPISVIAVLSLPRKSCSSYVLTNETIKRPQI